MTNPAKMRAEFGELLQIAIENEAQRKTLLGMFRLIERNQKATETRLAKVERELGKRLRESAAWRLFSDHKLPMTEVASALGIHKEAATKLIRQLLVEKHDFHGSPTDWRTLPDTSLRKRRRNYEAELDAIHNDRLDAVGASGHEAASPASAVRGEIDGVLRTDAVPPNGRFRLPDPEILYGQSLEREAAEGGDPPAPIDWYELDPAEVTARIETLEREAAEAAAAEAEFSPDNDPPLTEARKST